MSDRLRTTLLPLIAAFIWGIAFVAQKGNTVGALTFNAARSLVAFLFVLVVLAVMTRGKWQAKGPASAASAAASAASLQGKASGKGSASATQAKGLAPLAGLLTGSTPQETRATWRLRVQRFCSKPAWMQTPKPEKQAFLPPCISCLFPFWAWR